MFKRIAFYLIAAAITSASFAASNTAEAVPVHKTMHKKFSEISYVWVLYGNGCYYLYRVTTITASNDSSFALEFWEPMDSFSWAGKTVDCQYSADEMESM